ncbi:hypothetical protein DESC_930053 [Desulfosarcina cetonica]|nr:hypothetical protein DESC_930053 [Desulfosarcina cetonica]
MGAAWTAAILRSGRRTPVGSEARRNLFAEEVISTLHGIGQYATLSHDATPRNPRLLLNLISSYGTRRFPDKTEILVFPIRHNLFRAVLPMFQAVSTPGISVAIE